MSKVQVDNWIWGSETILWGYAASHQYTLKVLQPKSGITGCLSLQYHHHKSESWIVIEGVAWALAVIEGKVCTKLLRARQGINLPQGTWHRLAAVSNLKILEPSTPDAHAANKQAAKDVVRLHCIHGRPVEQLTDKKELELVQEAAQVTELAMQLVEQGREPEELHPEYFDRIGSFEI